MANAKRLLWASFFTIFAAGVGFAIRGGILGDWAKEYGFTMTELGGITGGGLVGFGFIIIFFSLFADAVGYGKLMVIAFTMHFLSAVLTLAAGFVFKAYGKDACFWCLYTGMFMFAVGNGTCEAVVNPLVATLFPREKTHYLNILHAGWPAGLVFGALAAYFMGGHVAWQIQMSLFLLPTLLYGAMMVGQPFPVSEAKASGANLGDMLAQFAAPVLLFLLVIHAMVGYVELGTDSWISKITGAILADPGKGLLLFIYTSMLMTALRFFAGPIVHKISPLGLLFTCSILGSLGLTLLSGVESGIMAVVAATVYALGKTFFWPTMLGVASERFPRGGAMVLGAMGGIGMLSAGFLGGPGIGYKQDYFASNNLKEKSPEAYQRYVAKGTNSFLIFPAISGLDGAKVGVLDDKVGEVGKETADAEKAGKKLTDAEIAAIWAKDSTEIAARIKAAKDAGKTDADAEALSKWWATVNTTAQKDKDGVTAATLHGGRMALKYTAIVPAVMAICYLLLILYFKAKGGYSQVHIEDHADTRKEEVATH